MQIISHGDETNAYIRCSLLCRIHSKIRKLHHTQGLRNARYGYDVGQWLLVRYACWSGMHLLKKCDRLGIIAT